MAPIDKYNQRAKKMKSLLCVGLDSDFGKLPERFKKMEYPQFEFNKWIIDETYEYASSFKVNSAFYEARGEKGIKELKMTFDYINDEHKDIFTILDAKRGDIGNTNNGYVAFAFDYLGADSITIQPYMGQMAVQPFLDRKDKVIIVLAKTSNQGSDEFQDLQAGGKKLWQKVAEQVSYDWNNNQNCMLVMGATYPEEIKQVRNIVGDMTLLIPGVGAQGGNTEEVIKAGLNGEKLGLMINSSRGIIFSDNPKEEARKLRNEINKYI